MNTKQKRVEELVRRANSKPEGITWGQMYYDLGLEMFPVKTRECNGTETLDPRNDKSENIQAFISYVTD